MQLNARDKQCAIDTLESLVKHANSALEALRVELDGNDAIAYGNCCCVVDDTLVIASIMQLEV